MPLLLSCLVIMLACLSWAEGVRLLMSSLTGADQNRADPKAAIIRDHYLWFCFPYYCLWMHLCSGLPLRLVSRQLIPPSPRTMLPLSVWWRLPQQRGHAASRCLPWRTRHSRSVALSSSKERSLPPQCTEAFFQARLLCSYYLINPIVSLLEASLKDRVFLKMSTLWLPGKREE